MLHYLSNIYFVHAMAWLATLLFAMVMGVQILVGLDVLPVTIAWGGRHTELTPKLRIASFGAAAILALFIYIIRYRAGLIGEFPRPGWVRVGAWLITGLMALNTGGNLASKSRVERFVFTPITLGAVVASFVVAASRLS